MQKKNIDNKYLNIFYTNRPIMTLRKKKSDRYFVST